MKLNKKTERLIKRRAAEFKKLYETPNPVRTASLFPIYQNYWCVSSVG